MNSIADIRKEYILQALTEEDAADDPFTQFENWWSQAVQSSIEEVNAMTLATADKTGRPSARIVLLKGFDKSGFTFYTNYESRKGKELETNPQACLVFFWKELERQIRIEGNITKTNPSESNSYFASRPYNSQVGAWASPQSKVISGREIIEANVKKYSEKFHGMQLERPSFWGGYTLSPDAMEFWQGRPGRLHDRIQYARNNDVWVKHRLAP